MASLNAGRITRFVLLLAALLFLGLLLQAILTVSAGEVLPRLRLRYCLLLALGRLIGYLLPVQLSAVLLAASLPGPPGPLAAKRGAFHAQVAPCLYRLLFLTIVYAFLVLAVGPQMRWIEREMRAQARLAGVLRGRLQLAQEARDYAEALDLTDRLLALEPGSPQLLRQQSELRIAMEKAGAGRRAPPEQEPAALRSAPRSVSDLLNGARESLEQGDPITALYDAQLARQMEPGRREAAQLADRARKQIALRTSGDDARAIRYRRMKEGADALQRDDPFSAYRIFRALESEDPRDPQLSPWLEKAHQALKGKSFFVEDAERAFLLPGSRRIVLLGGSRPEERELIRVGKAAQTGEGTYLQEIEVLRFRADGRIVLHLQAPAGKLLPPAGEGSGARAGGTLLLRGVGRADGGLRVSPVYLVGRPQEGEPPGTLAFPVREELLPLLGEEGRGWEVEGPLALLRARGELGRLGWGREPVEQELMRRGLEPFTFLILSLLALSLGWAFRSRRPGRLPLRHLLLLPALPASAWLGAGLYSAAGRTAASAALLALGFLPGFLLLLGFQAVLLFVALAILAGQRTEDRLAEGRSREG